MSIDRGKGIDVKTAWNDALASLGEIDDPEFEKVMTPNELPEDEKTVELDDTSDDVEEPDTEEGPTKLSDLVEDEEQPEEDSKPSLDLDAVIELPNVGEVTLKELMDGYLRQSDYTQKTQTLADQRKDMDRAVKLYELMREDTVGTIARLALEAGLVDQDTLENVKPSRAVERWFREDAQKAPDSKSIDEIVAEKVKEALGKNEQLQQMQQQEATHQIIAELDSIERDYEVTLDEADRRAILQTALKENNTNLEHVYLKMQARLLKAQANKQRIRDGSTPRPGQRVPTKSLKGEKPNSVREAWEWAVASNQ